jgi:tetratricopeptide (TPR) repeat protein
MKKAILLIAAILLGCGGASDPILTTAKIERDGRRLDNAYNSLSKGLYSEEGKNVNLKKIPEAWYEMGRLHMHKMEIDKMLAAFAMVKELEAKEPKKASKKTFSEKSDIYVKAKAGEAYNAAAAKYNDRLKETDEAKKETLLKEAVEDMNTAIALEPTVENYVFRARIKGMLKEDPISDFESALKIEPENADVHQQLGFSFFNAKNYEKSAKHLAIALKTKTNDLEIAKFLAYSYQNSSQYDKAIAAYKTMLEGDATNVTAIDNLTPLYYSQKMYKETIENATMAINENAECNRDHYVWLAYSYFAINNELNEAKKTDELKKNALACIELIEKGVETDKFAEDGELWSHLSTLYAQTSQSKKSKDAEKKAKKYGSN